MKSLRPQKPWGWREQPGRPLANEVGEYEVVVRPHRRRGQPADARRLMAFDAGMFDEGPVAALGVGRGYFLEALRTRGIEAVGTDISSESVAAAAALGFHIDELDATAFLRISRASEASSRLMSSSIWSPMPPSSFWPLPPQLSRPVG